VRKLYQIVATVSIIGSSAPVAAQDGPLRTNLDDPRLWLSSWDAVPPLAAEIRFSLPADRAVLGTSHAAGYVLGILAGLRLREEAAPPKELGLWLRGWYEGSAVTGLSDRSGLQPGVALYGSSFFPSAGLQRGGNPPLVDGIVRGFLAVLANTSGS
jgi:hypothetical protein